MQQISADQMQSLHDLLARSSDILVAYLFGSFARGKAGPLSDLDVAILLAGRLSREGRLQRRLDIGWEISHLLRVDAVDVVVLNDAPLPLAYRVLRDGVVLFCQDEDARIRYQADIISRYLDFKPLLERHARALIHRGRTGDLFNGHHPYHQALQRHRRRRGGPARNAEDPT